MIKGMDFLAGACYPKVFSQFAKNYALGVFAETFGDAFSEVETALIKGCKLIRIQLIWSDTHSFGNKNINKIKKLARKYNALANRFPEADIRLSPFCEHNLNNPDKYLDICQLEAPNCLIVNTPWKGAFSKKYINEIHGSHQKPQGRYMYSADGGYPRSDGTYDDIVDKDAEAILQEYGDAEVFFMWVSRFNLRYNTKDKAKRPQRIKEKDDRSPDKKYAESVAYLFTPKGPFNIKAGTILKSHSERHTADDRKGDKLLFITPKRSPNITLKKNGKKVGACSYYGPFDGGGYRFYSTKMGFTFGMNVEIFQGSERLGICNPGFRGKPYR